MSALPTELQMIPMDRIEVLNPRERNNRIFEVIVDNIKTLGLKKPVTVTPRPGPEGDVRYMLICGEGRLKAFKALGETQIPALVVTRIDAATADPVPAAACEKLAEDAAQTTLMVVEFQRWYREQRDAVENSR